MTTTLVHHLLDAAADRSPDGIVVVHGTSTLTYRHARDRSRRIAHALIDIGVRPGDRVVLALENGCDWVTSYFGILLAGGVAVPLPAGPRSDRLPAVVRDCAPRAAIVDDVTATCFAEAFAAVGCRRIVAGASPSGLPPSAESLDDRAGRASSEAPAVRRIDLDLAAIVYTSGSTGTPRGVMLAHLNILSNTRSIVEYLGLVPSDRVMVVLPFYYVYGLSLLHTHVAVGATLVIDNRFAFPNAVVKTMHDQRVTNFAGVPSTYAMLLRHSNIARTPLPSLRFCTQAGAAMAPALVREWLAAMPGAGLVVMYGATEASARLTYLPPGDLPRKVGSIGRAIPNVEMRILRDDGTEAGVGEPGELVARGSNLARGYWNAPEDTAAAFTVDGYRTGDLATRDAEGFLYVVGRRRDMLKVGAHRVSAKEIEDVLFEHASVFEAAVVGAPHELLGEAPVAFVVARDADAGIDAVGLTAHCRARLAEHKVPVRFEALASLPKSDAGKADKHQLRAIVAAWSAPSADTTVG